MHPFDDARLSIERAHEHIKEYEARLQNFMTSEPWAVVVEPKLGSAEYVHKVRFGDGIDRRIKLPVVDALRNLRSALDLLTAACARLNGASRLSHLHFPFLENPSAWEKVAKERCRCVPDPVIDFFRTLHPHPGGDDQLYALAKIRNQNEHWALSSVELSVFAVAISRRGERQQIIDFPAWPASGVHEIELFTSPSRERDYTCYLVIKTALQNGPAPLSIAPPEATLRILAEKVSKIVNDTEDVMRANGFLV
jgi:hypothetical protein